MSENQNRDFSKYNTMSTEELEEILRLDAASAEEDSDTELLLHIMGVLADRKTGITGKTAQESWESFQENYLDEESTEDMQEQKKRRSVTPWLRRLVAAAAVVVLMVCIPLSAKAFGWGDIWNVFARWARETFFFVSVENTDATEPDMAYNGEIASLKELLELGECDSSIIPTWIPEGFVQEKLERDATPAQEVYRALYANGDKVLKIRVHNFLSADAQIIEIEEDFSEIYTALNVEYYIFENTDQLRVVWIVDSYECMISGDISIEEAKEMIDSIEKG